MTQDLHTPISLTFSSVSPPQISSAHSSLSSQTLSVSPILPPLFLTFKWDRFHVCWRSSYASNPPGCDASAIQSPPPSLIPTATCVCLFPTCNAHCGHFSYTSLLLSGYTKVFLTDFRERGTSLCCCTYLCLHGLALVCGLGGNWTCNLGLSGWYPNQLPYLARA